MLITAIISSTLDNLIANIWETAKIPKMNDTITSIEKNPDALIITKNQKDSPAETANALNLGEESCILNWINECD